MILRNLCKSFRVFSRGSVRQRCASDVWYTWRMEESWKKLNLPRMGCFLADYAGVALEPRLWTDFCSFPFASTLRWRRTATLGRVNCDMIKCL
jgi:hypothetical protein